MTERFFGQDRCDWRRNVSFYRDESSSPFQEKLNEEKRATYGLDESRRRVLDVGAGVGGPAARMIEEGRVVFALDFVLEMALAAREKHPNLPYVVASAHRLPFKDGIFDAVVADGVLHHLKIQGILDDSAGEAARVLREGGRLCSFDRNGSVMSRLLLTVFVALNKAMRLWKPDYASSATGHERSLKRSDERLIDGAGFVTIVRRNVSSLPYFLAIVLTNAAGYLAGPRSAAAWRLRFYPAAAWFEDRIGARALTVEACVVRERTMRDDKTRIGPTLENVLGARSREET
jgi:SAM-dependent methyltransferase